MIIIKCLKIELIPTWNDSYGVDMPLKKKTTKITTKQSQTKTNQVIYLYLGKTRDRFISFTLGINAK